MKKLTKRQRKALRGPNYASKVSLLNGREYIIGGVTYRGNVSRRLPLVRV